MGPRVAKGLAKWLYGLIRSYHGVIGASYRVYRGLFKFRAHLSSSLPVEGSVYGPLVCAAVFDSGGVRFIGPLFCISSLTVFP